MAKPFIKWVGGKRFLVSTILQYAPKKIDTYYEPFIGGGAVFFALEEQKRFKHAIISDINKDLIAAYISIRDSLDKVIHYLSILDKKYKEKTDEDKKNFYYTIRALDRKSYFNKLSYEKKCARLIFLNKTGFNGLYRINSKGFFNTPHGKYKNPKILNLNTLISVSKALQGIEILHEPFTHIFNRVLSQNDFVYFDPPYWPINSDSFTSYTWNGFKKKDHVELCSMMKILQKNSIYTIQSNSDVSDVHTLYSDFCINKVEVPRRINSNGSDRGNVSEVLIFARKNA